MEMRDEREIAAAVNECCTCSGDMPRGQGCPACEVWRMLFFPKPSNAELEREMERIKAAVAARLGTQPPPAEGTGGLDE